MAADSTGGISGSTGLWTRCLYLAAQDYQPVGNLGEQTDRGLRKQMGQRG